METKERGSMAEAIREWNELKEKHRFDLRLLHPSNRAQLNDCYEEITRDKRKVA